MPDKIPWIAESSLIELEGGCRRDSLFPLETPISWSSGRVTRPVCLNLSLGRVEASRGVLLRAGQGRKDVLCASKPLVLPGTQERHFVMQAEPVLIVFPH